MGARPPDVTIGDALSSEEFRPAELVTQARTAEAAGFSYALGRFFLGLGTGENLNEHVVGAGWPGPGVRLDMLAEAST